MSPSSPPARAEARLRAPRPWRPTALVRVSAGLHVAGAGLAALRPDWGLPAAAAAIGLNHLVLAGVGLVPRSAALGANLTRLPEAAVARREVALTFDDGPDPATTPLVLERLERAGARATFFCVGRRVLEHPRLARAVVAQGHAIENHSFAHGVGFACYGWRRLLAELAAAQRAVADTVGIAPAWFRAPFGIRSPLLEPALARTGLALASWTRRGFDTREPSAARIARRLVEDLRAGSVLVLHDGVATGHRADAGAMLAALDAVLEAIRDAGLAAVTLRDACAPRR